MENNEEDPHLSYRVIKLNVGGHIYMTCLSTLTRDPNSMLASMFSGRYKVTTQEDGTVFIDRDGYEFCE